MLTGIKLTTMASNPVIFSHKSPTFFHNFHKSNVPKFRKHDSVINPSFKSFISSGIRCNGSKKMFRELGVFGNGLRESGRNEIRVRSSSGGGDGGSGGSGGGSGGGGGGGDKWSFIAWYLSLLEKYPVWTKAATSALLTFVGDLICQVLIDQAPCLDFKRVSLFTFLGMALVGPTLHYWYLYLSKLVTMTGASGAILRLVIDQFIFAPVFIGVFLSMLVTLEGRPSQVLPKLQQEWLSSVIANWQLWIPFQFLNFRFVPQQFQVLAANFIALVWNVILSYKAHKEVVVK